MAQRLAGPTGVVVGVGMLRKCLLLGERDKDSSWKVGFGDVLRDTVISKCPYVSRVHLLQHPIAPLILLLVPLGGEAEAWRNISTKS